MEVCSNHHEEIVYDKGVCPLCLALENLEKEVLENEKDMKESGDKIEALEEQIEEYKQHVDLKVAKKSF